MPVIDDYERDTLTYYTGDTGAYSIDATRATSGTRALHSIGSNNERITAIEPDGLHAPAPGEVVEFDLYPVADQHLRLNLAYGGPTDRLILTVKTDSTDPLFSLQLVEGGLWSTVFRERTAIPSGEWLNVRLRWDAGNRQFTGTIRNAAGDVVAVDSGETTTKVPMPYENAFAWETVSGERWVDNLQYTDLGTALGTEQLDHYIGPEAPGTDPAMHSNPGWGLHFEADKQFDLGTATIYANRQGKLFAELHEFDDGTIGDLVDSTEISVASGYTDFEVDLDISGEPGEYLLTRDFDSPIDMSTEGVELAKHNSYADYDIDSTDYLTLYGSDHPNHGTTTNWYNFYNIQFTVYEETEGVPMEAPETGDQYADDGRPLANDAAPFGTVTGDVPDVGWERTFNDRFEAGSLDTTQWSIGYPWGRTMAPKLEYVRDSDVWVDGSRNRLVLRLDRDDEYHMRTGSKADRETNGWYSGAVNAIDAFSQRYGFFEASIKLPEPLAGVLPAFWMRRADGNWPPEINIVQQEASGKETKHSIRYLNDDAVTTEVSVYEDHVQRASAAFHVYGCRWTPNGVWWYLDGKLIGRQTVASGTLPGQLNRNQTMFPLLSCHLWNDTRLGDPRTHTEWPYTWEIDWVQVWEDPALQTGISEPADSHETLPGAEVTLHRNA